MSDDDTDRTPSNDIDAEKHLLAALIQSPTARLEILPILEPNDFYRPNHELIAGAIAKLEADGTTPDPVLLAEHLGHDLERAGGYAYLFELNGLPVITANADHHLRIIQDHKRRRNLSTLADRLHQAAHQDDDLDDYLATLTADLTRLATARESRRALLTLTGSAFILDTPHNVPCIWGDTSGVAWAQGESLQIVGPPGVGKTTLTGQLIRARLGLDSSLLDMPVVPGARRVLYLAMDRPQQIARALARHFTEDDRAILADCMRVHKGPPPADLAKHPETLLAMAQEHDADTVVIDSIKDAALGLSDDEVAAGYNRARQLALANGVELIELHHNVKRGATGGPAKTLEDVYGSRWITAGAGSVIFLWGEAGDPVVELRHLKQPTGEVGPFRILHDHDTGQSTVFHATDLIAIATLAGRNGGLTAKAAASALFDIKTPTSAQTEKARRRLERHTRAGQLVQIRVGNRATAVPAAWARAAFPAPSRTSRSVLSDTFTAPGDPEPSTTPSPPSRPITNPQVTDPPDLHADLHDLHGSGPSRLAPPLEGGQEVPQTPEMCPICCRFTCDCPPPDDAS